MLLQSFEEELGSQVRRQRVIGNGFLTREDFCVAKAAQIPGVTPEMLKSIEKGDLGGAYEFHHLMLVVGALWHSDRCRDAMGTLAGRVWARKTDQQTEQATAQRGAAPQNSRIEYPLTNAGRAPSMTA